RGQSDLARVRSARRLVVRADRAAPARGRRAKRCDVRPVAVVTGASSGIGAELARVFAANGHDLALVARREQRLQGLAEETAASGRPKPLVVALDLAQRDAGVELGRALAANDCEPQYVVNNAGFGLIGHAAELQRAQQLEMIDLNARTL